MTTRPNNPATRLAAGLLAAAVALAGCAKSSGPILEPAADAPVWPAAPERPRIRYLGQLATDKDLRPGRSFGAGVGAFLFGKTEPQTMVSPIGVCTDGADRVFVADSNARVVHVFDLESRKYARWAPPGGRTGFRLPVAVAYDPIGRLVVADSGAGTLFVFDAAGGFLGTLGEGRLKRPTGIAVDAARGRLLIADAAAHQVVVLTREDVEIGRIGQRGTGLGQFNFPTQVALDGAGQLFVSDTLNFRVQVFDGAYAPLRQIGKKGDLPGYFSQPKGIALDAEGHLYVVDAHFEAVQLFSTQGDLLMSFGREGRGPGEFWLPAGISIDPKGRVWIADSYNRRVQVFQFLPERTTP